ncbi:NDR1/HIN1-like protein [Parvicella tangerina]|uniref:Late embryogenesis abundant protein LEA-2 subgroup domain-containing protein n=1 Tax=Parvicella tangerina TaxID=2829795 RepID=A0A916JQ91_9FLAO|nr:LEA type 2 family protein [Parvicella tangerina]CAG5086763.1 hypothetical protein CRYO30217_03269 [Parvicella tangerina]
MKTGVKIGTAVAGTGFSLGLFGLWFSNQIDYQPISIQVHTISATAINFKVVFSVENPTQFNVKVSKQFYEIFIAGHLVSKASAEQSFRVMKRGTSTLLVDLQIKFDDIKEKIPAFNGVDMMLLNDLQVTVSGKLSAKIGVLPVFPIPIRSYFTIGDLL